MEVVVGYRAVRANVVERWHTGYQTQITIKVVKIERKVSKTNRHIILTLTFSSKLMDELGLPEQHHVFLVLRGFFLQRSNHGLDGRSASKSAKETYDFGCIEVTCLLFLDYQTQATKVKS